jgi:hypothetical protein
MKKWCEKCGAMVELKDYCGECEDACHKHCGCEPKWQYKRDTPTCPFCDYEFSYDDIWYNEAEHNIDHQHEGHYQADCPRCRREFDVQLIFAFKYTCEEIGA